ncbi:MAG: MerR family transcriptional regulator [Desulfobacterales bacterium]|nr:MerR family transcriptional regulator [Desulfobacterales bacterium]
MSIKKDNWPDSEENITGGPGAKQRRMTCRETREMKIGELVKKTGVSKETIHYYIREGVLPRPRKTGTNKADYGQHYVDQIRLIKALRQNYFLPISVIKKLMEKQKEKTPADQLSFRFLTEFIRPLDQLLSGEVAGRQAFMEATGISTKWLEKMEQWNIITGEQRNGQRYYSRDDVIIGKLLVDMERTGLGPRDGFNPEELRYLTDMIRELVAKNVNRKFGQSNSPDNDRMSSEEISRQGSGSTEIMSLFFYHIYRKIVKEEYRRYFRNMEKGKQDHGEWNR